MSKILVSKIDAAKQQLDTAVRLIFDGGDPVATHTLVGAASNILSNLVEHDVHANSWDKSAQEATGLDAAEYFGLVRETQNFFKHAKDDPDQTIKFAPSDTQHVLIIAVLNAGELDKLSIPQSVFELWYLARNRRRLGPGFRGMDEARKMFPDLADATEAEALRIGREALA